MKFKFDKKTKIILAISTVGVVTAIVVTTTLLIRTKAVSQSKLNQIKGIYRVKIGIIDAM